MQQKLLWIAGVSGLVGVAAGLAGFPSLAAGGAVAMLLVVLILPWMDR